jgi:hypothetical protein
MNITKSKVAVLVLGVASLVLVSIAPAAAHKPHGSKHHPMQNEGVPKPQSGHPMQNEGVPKPQPAPSIGDGQWHANPKPPIVHDKRTKPVVRDHRGGTVVVTRDHRGGNVPTKDGRRGARGKTPCLGNLCNVKVCAASVCL